MNNFERITASPEALGAFLASLPVLQGPWDDAFHRTFCDTCHVEDCDAEGCPHQAERNNPTWWIRQETEDTDLSNAPAEIKATILGNDRLLNEREAKA